MSDGHIQQPDTREKTTCLLKEMLGFFQEPICVADRQETWVGWDAWVDSAAPAAARSEPEGPGA